MMKEETYRIVIVGESGVGKSSIMSTFVHHKFPEAFISTIGIDYSGKKLITKFNGNIYQITLKIFDTAGQKRFQNITEYYQTTTLDGLVVVFDITNMDSFIRAEELIERSREISALGSQLPILLVGNKIDLAHERCISSKRVQELVTKYNLGDYIEISAKTNENHCEEVFSKISQLTFDSRLFEIHVMDEAETPSETTSTYIQRGWYSFQDFLNNILFCYCK